MKKKLCLCAALILSLSSLACQKVEARIEIRDANQAYEKEDYATALKGYIRARKIDPSFPDLDRLIGYSQIGLYVPDDKSAVNEQHADAAIAELSRYLKKRPDDRIARDALINMYLNANRTSQAIDYFRGYLQQKPGDLEAVKSVATLYAKQGNFNESLNWYEKITLLDSKNPESFYIYGVVCYEKVAKNPPADPNEKRTIITKGQSALAKAIQMKPDYFEAMAYLNLLYRQQALVETDPVKQQQLIAEADRIRNQAVEIIKKKKADAQTQASGGAKS
jgi:tetratricopeptide (TPR) repeat protein